MTVRDQLDRSLHGASTPDLHALAAAARADGARVRRRRTATRSVVASAAAVAAVVGGTAAWSSIDRPGPAPSPASAASPTPTPAYEQAVPGGERVASTSRGVVAALAWSVSQVVDGDLGGFAGQIGAPYDPPGPGEPGARDVYATVTWQPRDGLGGEQVGINVRYDDAALVARLCAEPDVWVTSCRETFDEETGDRVVFLATRDPGTDQARRTVVFARAHGAIVSVSASNSSADAGTGEVEVHRPSPRLSEGDLWEIARRGIWGRTMPVSYVEAGDSLPGYREIDSGF